MTQERTTYVVGHKNPDTDSICAAIAYANLKSKLTGRPYEARRAGHINEETQFVLHRFDVEPPKYLGDVRTQVRDMEIRRLPGASKEMSLKKAWEEMREAGVVTLCVTEDEHLSGVLTTGDIVQTYMDVYDSDVLSTAQTSYRNIVETLEGELVTGEIEDTLTEGKTVIATASPEMMENLIEPGDVVILGNRYETQLCAIEMNAGCLVVCEGAKVATTILGQAKEHQCKIITTPHDTFTVARLIYQSMPVRYFMNQDTVVSFHLDDAIEDIVQIMAQQRHRYFPVLDEQDRYVGMISRRNVLGASKKQVILVDHNEKSQAVNGIDDAEIMEIIDHHRLGTVATSQPVFFRNQPLGSTSTIISLMYEENHVEIDPTTAGLLVAAILSDTLMYRSPTCTPLDKEIAEKLAKIAGIQTEEFAREMFRAGSNLGSKTATEIIHQDFKKFSVEEKTIGIGQINSMSSEELTQILKKVQPELKAACKEDGLDMLFFMMTDIVRESSDVIYAGDKAEFILQNAFLKEPNAKGVVRLPGVVSRKKQLLPNIVDAIQQ